MSRISTEQSSSTHKRPVFDGTQAFCKRTDEPSTSSSRPRPSPVVQTDSRRAQQAGEDIMRRRLEGMGATQKLELGARGPDVVKLQKALASLGYQTGPADGYLGPVTERAVRAFQRDHGCFVDGWAGPQTMAAMDRALNQQGGVGDAPSITVGDTPVVDGPKHGAPTGGAVPITVDTAAAPGVEGMLAWAHSKIGTPYAAVNPFRFGDVPWDGKPHTSVNGSGTVFNFPKGTQVFDCSGFVVAAFRQRGVDLAAHGLASSSAFDADTNFLKPLSREELAPGDLIVYNKKNGVGHVVIYLGDGQCIDASGSKGVSVHPVDWDRAKSFRRVPVPEGQ